MIDHSHDLFTEAGDAVAAVVTIGTVAQWLPSVAALFTIIWRGLRINDWLRTRRSED